MKAVAKDKLYTFDEMVDAVSIAVKKTISYSANGGDFGHSLCEPSGTEMVEVSSRILSMLQALHEMGEL